MPCHATALLLLLGDQGVRTTNQSRNGAVPVTVVTVVFFNVLLVSFPPLLKFREGLRSPSGPSEMFGPISDYNVNSISSS